MEYFQPNSSPRAKDPSGRIHQTAYETPLLLPPLG